MEKVFQKLTSILGKKVKKNYPLAPLATFRIGGRAEYFFVAKTADELIQAYQVAKKLKLPFHVIAGGSNIVVADGLLKGLLIKVMSHELWVKGNSITVGAGMNLQKLIRTSINRGLKGLETLSGIPGTVGGAIVGNAGAYGHEISKPLIKVEISDGKRRRWISKKSCRFAYRDSIFKHKQWLLLRAQFQFRKGEKEELRKISRDIIKLRSKKYPSDLRCPGSFFKNILVKDLTKKAWTHIDRNKIIAGKLPTGWVLERVGAKGMKSGGIEITKWHANLFINRGGGKAHDVKRLAKMLKQKVRKKFGIELEEEIRYIE